MNRPLNAAEYDRQQSFFDRYMEFHIEEADETAVTLVFHNNGSAWDNPNGTLYGGVFYGMAA